jgi:glycerol-3-phosphate acyltransferase PlsY
MLLVVLVAGYLIGAIPMGYVVVLVIAGQDVRQAGNGRTGGTGAMRAAGLAAGVVTTLLDSLKGAGAVWLAQWLLSPEARGVGMALAGLAAVLGHSFPVFLRFRGANGIAPSVGAAMALWPWSVTIVVPAGVLVLLGMGSASAATLVMAALITAVFAYRAYATLAPVEFALFGLGACVILLWQVRRGLPTRLRIGGRQGAPRGR